MAIIINFTSPMPDGSATVKNFKGATFGSINATGTVTKDGTMSPAPDLRVFAKVFSGKLYSAKRQLPQFPPGDCAETRTDRTGAWSFKELHPVSCTHSTQNPSNQLVLWVFDHTDSQAPHIPHADFCSFTGLSQRPGP